MSNLLRAQLPSDDEEDDDYDPTSDKTAEKGDLVKVANGTQHKRKRGAAGGSVMDAQGSEDEEEYKPRDPLAVAKKRKAQAAWQALQQQQPAPAATAKKKPIATANVSLASLCRPASKTAKPKADDLVHDAAAKALELAKDGVAAASQQGKVTITETRRFAGQNITVNKVVDAGSQQAQQAAQPPAPKTGLDAILQSMEAAKKVNVLDKSRHDWSDFKRDHTEVQEELEGYKKSNDKYLDKVDFLQRSELREYEQERDKRLASDIRTRGRT